MISIEEIVCESESFNNKVDKLLRKYIKRGYSIIQAKEIVKSIIYYSIKNGG